MKEEEIFTGFNEGGEVGLKAPSRVFSVRICVEDAEGGLTHCKC